MSEKTKKRGMTEKRLERRLVAMFARAGIVRDAGSFEDRGIMTTNRGLVVEFQDGSEFQVTLVCSGRGR